MQTEIPWLKKYKVKTEDELYINKKIEHLLKSKNISNMIFYGPSGTGKKSTINLIANNIYDEKHKSTNIKIINASLNRGVDIIRDELYIFANSMIIENKYTYKLIIINNIDELTVEAQRILRTIIEENLKTLRFCLICNTLSNIDTAIISRCITYKFTKIPNEFIKQKLMFICDDNKIKYNDEGIDVIVGQANGNLKDAINLLYLVRHSKVKPNRFYNYIKIIPDENINKIMVELTSEKKLKEKIDYLENNKYKMYYIIENLSKYIIKNINTLINRYNVLNILINLADINKNLIKESNEKLEMIHLINILNNNII